MTWLLDILALVGISLLVLGIILLVIFILLILLVIWVIRKHPIFSIFLLILMIVIATLELLTPATIALGITEWVTTVIIITTQYKKLKKAFK